MSSPWFVFYVGTFADPSVHRTEDTARAEIERTNEATAGNVDTRAMPLSVVQAAPDLLAALESLVEIAEYQGISPLLTEVARAAIAKAKGEA